MCAAGVDEPTKLVFVVGLTHESVGPAMLFVINFPIFFTSSLQFLADVSTYYEDGIKDDVYRDYSRLIFTYSFM